MRTTLLPLLAAALLAGCASRPGVPPPPARINHTVLFKLADPGDADELIRDCDRLAAIPGVVSYYRGRHIDIGRPTVFSDYDVGFFVGFDSVADYRSYVDHPVHVEVVQKWRPRWVWVRVYDVLDERRDPFLSEPRP
jgi:hypothetical protein